ncbi:MAG TPA: hypothetical protein VJN93_11320 [Candidatus Acidoferrum sp.]|nr:hypothetical protein [Candidatus Acidoferrum sp.]
MSYAQRRRFLWILFIAGLLLLAVVAASGTTLSRLNLDDLARESTAIARLRCLGSSSFWDQREIWTVSKFEVLEREKGDLPSTVSVRLLGGAVGHLRSHVAEVPAFRPGEEVFLFLWGEEGKPFQVLGWSQGTFRVRHDPQTGTELVTQDSASASIFDPRTRAFHRRGFRNLPVALFRARLQKALKHETK